MEQMFINCLSRHEQKGRKILDQDFDLKWKKLRRIIERPSISSKYIYGIHRIYKEIASQTYYNITIICGIDDFSEKNGYQ